MAPSLLLSKMPMTPLRVMGMVAGVAVICLIFSAFTAPNKSNKLGAVLDHNPLPKRRETSGRTMAGATFWRTFDFQRDRIPAEVNQVVQKVTVESKRINIMGSDTFYREALPPSEVESSGEVVVLLHGAAFQSKNWLNINTIHLLAAMGHRVIAIDLPGYGQTEGAQPADMGDYLQALMSHLKVNQPIVVSPSMSGQFSIPYLLKSPLSLAGYVPVAPVHTAHGRAKYQDITVPTLIIYGEKDTGLGHKSRDDLSNIPTSQVVELPNAGHPAYLDQPDLFHKYLYNFIKQVHSHRATV